MARTMAAVYNTAMHNVLAREGFAKATPFSHSFHLTYFLVHINYINVNIIIAVKNVLRLNYL